MNEQNVKLSLVGECSLQLLEALRAGSNLANDWLWLATQVTTVSEQRYCLERALHIDPNHAPARQALHRLNNSGANGLLRKRAESPVKALRERPI